MSRRVSAADAAAEVLRSAAAHPGRTVWIGIDGCGGAGKSTLADLVAASVPRAVVVHVDVFAGPRLSEWDWDRFRAQVAAPLASARRRVCD